MALSHVECKLRFFPGAIPTSAGLALLETLEMIPRTAFTPVLPRMENILPMGAVRHITVHHTGFPELWLADDLIATATHLAAIQSLHTDPAGRNWADIGYHHAVDRLGRIWQLRDLQFQGAHVKNHNAHNVGIVVLGNFDLQELPTAQSSALMALLDFMNMAYENLEVYTHQQLADGPTSCPGKHLQTLMDMTFGSRA